MQGLSELFLSFFRIGLFTFGGGYAMIPLIEHEVVNQKHWMTQEEFTSMLAVGQSMPGPISVNTAVYVGYRQKGLAGAIATTLGIAVPSFVIILLIAMVFSDIQTHPTVEKVFKGLRPAVVALIAAPLVRMYKTCGLNGKNIGLPVAAIVCIWLFRLSPVYVILGAAGIGLLCDFLRHRHSENTTQPNNKEEA